MPEETTQVRPKVIVGPDDVEQPREVRWGHLRETVGHVAGDYVTVTKRRKRHDFGQGTTPSGRPRTLYEGDLQEALRVYRALDALFDGGALEGSTLERQTLGDGDA